MRIVGQETCPLPDDPVLAAMAKALNDGGQWAEIVDRDWRGVYMTDEARRIYGGRSRLAEPVTGQFAVRAYSRRLEARRCSALE